MKKRLARRREPFLPGTRAPSSRSKAACSSIDMSSARPKGARNTFGPAKPDESSDPACHSARPKGARNTFGPAKPDECSDPAALRHVIPRDRRERGIPSVPRSQTSAAIRQPSGLPFRATEGSEEYLRSREARRVQRSGSPPACHSERPKGARNTFGPAKPDECSDPAALRHVIPSDRRERGIPSVPRSQTRAAIRQPSGMPFRATEGSEEYLRSREAGRVQRSGSPLACHSERPKGAMNPPGHAKS